MKKLIFLLFALPTLLAAQEKLAAQQKAVQVPSCEAGSVFTIRVPVKFPDSMTVQYAWYRNDTLIDDTHKLLLGEKTIAYTVPADKAFGSAVYHFKYNLHDDHDGEWTSSPKYVVTFAQQQSPDCQMSIAGGIAGSEVVVLDLSCQMSNAGSIVGSAVVAPDHGSCQMSSAGSIVGE